ncbi:unnamed protein product [Macrosiphum euphorbiae]|uniref:YqaJ viral recombinase domain-containing protein n=1 Tax=Macrosiphum euphorbiae TaxID=13131 RepID=A0AAV0Y479_9HEMI|nr:unnamed protein product [Macrosiphum euphorbiae]
MWRLERLSRLTAINFGKNTIYPILYNSFNSKSVQYGWDMENIAKKHFEQLYGIHVNACGLCIDKDYPYLAASPDAMTDNNKVVEIKAPFAAKDTLNIHEAVESCKIKYCTIDNGKLKLKRTHDYFYQIQGQLLGANTHLPLK